MKKDKKNLTAEEIQQQNRQLTAQQWIPISDINNNIIYRKDNTLVGMLRVQPLNLDLLSDNEKRRIVDSLAEGINGENEGIQIFCIGRPVDLNSYLEWLQDKAKTELNFTKKRILKGFIAYASQIASSGEIIERRFYIAISKQAGVKAEDDLKNKLVDFKNKLLAAELKASICSDDELMDVLSLFANPVQASFEQVSTEMDLPSLLG